MTMSTSSRRIWNEEIRALKTAERDPSDLAQRVAKYQLWLAKKKAGKLPMYETVGRSK